MTKGGLPCAALVACVIYFFAGTAAGTSAFQEKKSVPDGTTSPEASAKKVFTQTCAKCHGTDGRGDTENGETLGVPDFTDAAWQEGASDKRLIVSVTHGRGGMPAFEKRLSKEEIAALVAYVRSLKNEK